MYGRPMQTSSASIRVAWVDIAKGICIVMVVMVHATLGVEVAAGEQGWMHYLVAWARPFRMPDFFLISGLFLGLVIDRPWLRYLDRKVVHFAYFYVLWLTIQFAFKAPGMAVEEGVGGAAANYLLAFVQPFGTLWFVYLLPIFFVFTRLVRGVPTWFVLASAAVLEMLPVATGSVVFDEFCARYVYFFAGYALAANVFRIADWIRANPGTALGLMAPWTLLNAFFVFTPAPAALVPFLQPDIGHSGAQGGIAELPFVSLVLGTAGLVAVIAVATLLDGRRGTEWLRWLGTHSIVIYLAFFLPMAITRVVLLRTGIVQDIGSISLIVTVVAIAGPAVLYGLVKWSGWGNFLFERPAWAHVDMPAKAREAAV